MSRDFQSGIICVDFAVGTCAKLVFARPHGLVPLPDIAMGNRFFARPHVGYPTQDEELRILAAQAQTHPIDTLAAVIGERDILAAREAVKAVHIHADVARYITAIAAATRDHADLRLGVSPRGTLALAKGAQNCVTTTRRQLHMGRLVSVVMVIFAASHDRADWTMLFYLVPYVVAVVFTLVSEQIGRRAQHVRAGSLKDTGLAGQGAAATVATVMILALAGLLYALTPQASWPYLASKYGQKSVLGRLDESDFADASRQGGAGSGDGNASQRDGGNEWDEALSPWRGWPTPGGMREAATKKGMPVWQSSAIRRMADISDTLEPAWASVSATLADQLKRMGQWLKDNLEAILRSLFALLLILLAAGMVAMFRDMRTAAWLRTRFDYLYIARLKRHAAGRRGAIQFYRAMERLFALHDAPRAKTANTREFLSQAVSSRRPMQAAATELTLLFERFRYGVAEPDARQLARMRELYAELFRKAGE